MTQKEDKYTQKQLFDLIASEPENEVPNAGNDAACDPMLIDEHLSDSNNASEKCGSNLQQSIAPSQVPDSMIFLQHMKILPPHSAHKMMPW